MNQALPNANAISIRSIPFDVATLPANAIIQLDLTNRQWTYVTPLAGTKIYYVADSSGGAVNRKLTFLNGILTAET